MKQNKRTRIIFFLLVVYVLFQFFWWSYLIYELNTEIVELKQKLSGVSSQATPEYSSYLRKKLGMIIGEGTVFLLLLALGVYQIYRSIQKQERLSVQQNNFMLSVTHELKTPLASTRLQLETLLKRKLPQDKKEKIITNAIADTDRLTHLIENILIASKAEGFNFKPQLEMVNVYELINSLINKSNIFVNHKERIVLAGPQNAHLRTDKFAFSTVMINLIENALKYSDKEVVVKLKEQESAFVVEVIDQGIGIPAREKNLVFNKFYRSGNEETRRTKGTGLGLYIVKFLVEALGGKIRIIDHKPQGSIFKIEFPLKTT